MLFKNFKIPVGVVPVGIMDLSFYFLFVNEFHSNFPRPVNNVIAFDWVIGITEWTLEQNFHLLLSFPEAFHQTIVICPVQNWSLIDSCKVSHFST